MASEEDKLNNSKGTDAFSLSSAKDYIERMYRCSDCNVRFSICVGEADLTDYYRPVTEREIEAAGAFYALKNTNTSFSLKLLYLLEKKNLKPADVYRKAGIDKTTFSRLSGKSDYVPSKDTAIALALAAGLTLEEGKDLLERAGYSLSHSLKRDILLEYCFLANIRDAVSVNCLLDQLGFKLLGR